MTILAGLSISIRLSTPSKSEPIASTSLPAILRICRMCVTISQIRLSPSGGCVSERKCDAKFKPITPPASESFLIYISGRLRGCAVMARALEWDATNGMPVFFANSATFKNPPSDKCDTSITMPSRFISSSTSNPNGFKPFCMISRSVLFGYPISFS